MDLSADIVAELERRYEREDALARLKDLAERAGAQLLQPERVLSELRRPSGRWPVGAVLERLAGLPSTKWLQAGLRLLARDLLARSDSLRLAEQHQYNLLLRVILLRLPKPQARKLVRPLINHRLQERRNLAFSVFRWAGVDRRILRDVLERHRRTGEERLLKVVVAANGSGGMPDLLDLLPQFSDRYWQMRVLQAVLEAGHQIPFNVVQAHPTEFLQAMARAQHRASIPGARRLLRRPEMRSNPRVVAFYAWAMYALGEYREVLRVSKTLASRGQKGDSAA